MKKRSASSLSALKCWESGLSLMWALDWKDEAVLSLWSANEEQFDLVKNQAMSLSQHFNINHCLMFRDPFYA